jgi:phage terminase large subunit
MIELKIKLQQKQKEFYRAVHQTPVTLYGGAKGGGKSKGLRDIMLLRRFQYANSDGAIFRRSYPELEGNHIRPLFKDYPDLKMYYNEGKKILSLPNGSTLQFCHCQGETDVTLYQGREFQDLGIEEAGQWSEAMFQTLRGSNRSSRPGVPARTLLTANPGGIGHQWLKRLFIDRKFNEREESEDYAFIQALVDDNPALIENDPDYVRRLEAEPNEVLRKAYRYGSWDIFAGQFFSEIKREVHFIPAFPLPQHWLRFGAYDYGFSHPGAFGWFAVDEDGDIYMYREFIRAGLRIDQFAKEIKEYPDTHSLFPIVAGHDCWARKAPMNAQAAPTIAEEFLKHDIILKAAQIDRMQGAVQIRNYLAWQNLPGGRQKPRFYLFDTCPITFDCLTRMQHDPKNIEDVLKVDAVDGDPYSGDDPYDMVRMALMTRPPLTDRLPLHHPWGSKAWADQQTAEMEEKAREHFENLEKSQNGLGLF